MTSAEIIIEQVEAVGGELMLHGERIRCRLPERATHLLEQIRLHRDEVAFAIGRYASTVPAGIRLVSWNLKQPPVALDACSVVTDTDLFVRSTLEQLRVAIANPKRWMGWSVPELVERLSRVGVLVRPENSESKVLDK